MVSLTGWRCVPLLRDALATHHRDPCLDGATHAASPHPSPNTGHAITFFTEDDAGQLRGIAHVIKAAGGEVPDWMLQLKKERRHRKAKAPAAGGISTEPVAEGERKKKAQWRQKGKGRGGPPQKQQQGGSKGGSGAGKEGQRQQRKEGGGGGGGGGGKGQKRPAQQQQKPKQKQQQQGGKPPKRQQA